MEGQVYRVDYYKAIFSLPSDLMTQYRNLLNEHSHVAKIPGDWITSHKWSYLYHTPEGHEVVALEIWGEWARLPTYLFDPIWVKECRRLDVRTTLWEQTGDGIYSLGEHLTRADTGYNTILRNSKPRSKRNGRDAGGKGFAIGSHKSDLRISAYTRGDAKPALEYQCSGSILRGAISQIIGPGGLAPGVLFPWATLISTVVDLGDARLERVLDRAGIGSYWPVLHEGEPPTLPPLQHVARLTDEEEALMSGGDDEGWWELLDQDTSQQH